MAHVYCTKFSAFSREDIARFKNLLSYAENQRAQKLAIDELRKNFVIARGYLREILSQHLKIAPKSIIFSHNEFGKPELDQKVHQKSNLKFNISHSQDFFLVAVNKKYEVGIDIEYIKPKINYMAIAERFFTKNEVLALKNLPREMQKKAFFHTFARKEAILKAKGVGLTKPLQSVEVNIDPDLKKNWCNIKNFSSLTLDIDQNYAAALVVDKIQCTRYGSATMILPYHFFDIDNSDLR